MKVVVLGGDGFCGWPTSLNLSFSGHEVLIIDNLVRRKIDIDLEVQSLTPISSLEERIYQWNKITKKKIKFLNIDLSLNVHRLFTALNDYKPDVIIHFAFIFLIFYVAHTLCVLDFPTTTYLHGHPHPLKLLVYKAHIQYLGRNDHGVCCTGHHSF